MTISNKTQNAKNTTQNTNAVYNSKVALFRLHAWIHAIMTLQM